jgi:hypothetical protein
MPEKPTAPSVTAPQSPAPKAPPLPSPKPGDEVLFWPERKPFIQQFFAAKVVSVPEPNDQDPKAPRAQLLVSNHQTGRTFNVGACAYSAEPAPGCWGLPKVKPEGDASGN